MSKNPKREGHAKTLRGAKRQRIFLRKQRGLLRSGRNFKERRELLGKDFFKKVRFIKERRELLGRIFKKAKVY
jgi:hypothetical protein